MEWFQNRLPAIGSTNNPQNQQESLPSLPSIQRVFLRSVAAEDPNGQFTDVKGIQTYYKIAYPQQQQQQQYQPGSINHIINQEQQPQQLGQDRTVILLLHHFMGNLYTWRHLMQPIADTTGIPVVAYDRPAFGFTERLTRWDEAENPYTQQASVDFAMTLLSNLGFDGRKVVIIGVSGGGSLGSAITIKYAGWIKALILLCPAIRPQDQGPPPVACHILGSAPGRLFVKAALYQYLPFTLFYHHAESIPNWETVVKPAYRVPLTLPNFYESVSYLMKHFRPLEIYQNRNILHQTPVLYIAGKNDRYMPGDLHRQVYEEMVNGAPPGTVFEFQCLEECGHLPQDEKPREVLQLSLDFLRRIGVY
ncbi:hypothetical protein G9A89_012632 [Geosiphon pyriformis]|nr:hypothetical protein G9A89_012632 [Geosiphon pyriformis]